MCTDSEAELFITTSDYKVSQSQKSQVQYSAVSMHSVWRVSLKADEDAHFLHTKNEFLKTFETFENLRWFGCEQKHRSKEQKRLVASSTRAKTTFSVLVIQCGFTL